MRLEGGCHCRAVRFVAKVEQGPVRALHCNCSICTMTQFLHIIVPHENVELSTEEGALTSYRFGTRSADHLFCRHCGIKSFYQPRSHPESWSINANCLDEPVELEIEEFDGKNWERSRGMLQ